MQIFISLVLCKQHKTKLIFHVHHANIHISEKLLFINISTVLGTYCYVYKTYKLLWELIVYRVRYCKWVGGLISNIRSSMMSQYKCCFRTLLHIFICMFSMLTMYTYTLHGPWSKKVNKHFSHNTIWYLVTACHHLFLIFHSLWTICLWFHRLIEKYCMYKQIEGPLVFQLVMYHTSKLPVGNNSKKTEWKIFYVHI